MNLIFLFCFLVLSSGQVNAQTSANATVNQVELTAADSSKEEFSPELESMREYMKNQQQRMQKIELLSLDLDEAKLELELRQKKAELGKLAGSGAFSSNSVLNSSNSTDSKFKSATINYSEPEIKTLFVTDLYKQAVLSVDGNEITVKEGDKIGAVTIKEINSIGVVLLKEDNQQVKIYIK